MYWPILKNGHSSIQDWCKGFGFETYIRDEPPAGYRSFVVVREPFGRYISGLAQMWRIGVVADLDWDLYIDAVERFNRRTHTPWTSRKDRHFLPQINTVNRSTIDRTLFPLTRAGLVDLIEWLVDAGATKAAELPLDQQKPTSAGQIEHAAATLTRGIVDRHYGADVNMWREIESEHGI